MHWRIIRVLLYSFTFRTSFGRSLQYTRNENQTLGRAKEGRIHGRVNWWIPEKPTDQLWSGVWGRVHASINRERNGKSYYATNGSMDQPADEATWWKTGSSVRQGRQGSKCGAKTQKLGIDALVLARCRKQIMTSRSFENLDGTKQRINWRFVLDRVSVLLPF